MAEIGKFDLSKYDIGGAGSKANDGKLTGEEVNKARAEGWTVWDGFQEGDKAEQITEGDEKSKLGNMFFKTYINMHSSTLYKQYSKLKEKILEEKLAQYGIYPSMFLGRKAYNVDIILFDPRYKEAVKEAEIEAKKQLGLSENTFEFGYKPSETDKTKETKEEPVNITRSFAPEDRLTAEASDKAEQDYQNIRCNVINQQTPYYEEINDNLKKACHTVAEAANMQPKLTVKEGFDGWKSVELPDGRVISVKVTKHGKIEAIRVDVDTKADKANDMNQNGADVEFLKTKNTCGFRTKDGKIINEKVFGYDYKAIKELCKKIFNLE